MKHIKRFFKASCNKVYICFKINVFLYSIKVSGITGLVKQSYDIIDTIKEYN